MKKILFVATLFLFTYGAVSAQAQAVQTNAQTLQPTSYPTPCTAGEVRSAVIGGVKTVKQCDVGGAAWSTVGGAGGGDAFVADPLSQFAATTSAQLRGVLSDESGTAEALFGGATPSALTLTNATGLPITTGVSGLGTNVAAFLATPSSANLAAALTNETGTGVAVFGTSPDFTTGATIGGVAIPTISSTSTFTNKTMTSSTNVLGGVTMTLGSDADGDIYYRASGVLTRLPKGTAAQVLTMNGGATAPEWAAAAGGGGSPAGSSGDYQINNAGAFGAGVIAQASGRLTATPTAASSGVASYFRVITPADTTQTASTESIGAQFGGNTSAATVTRQWATGALVTQRENLFIAPTYAFAGASTLTTAATVAISGAPVAGTNATITNPYALWVQSGTSVFNSSVGIGGKPVTRLLEIFGVSNTAVARTVGNGSIVFEFGSFDVQSYGFLGTNSSHELRIKTGDIDRAIVDTSGRWVFGTTASIESSFQVKILADSLGRTGLKIEGAASNSAAVLVSKSGSSGTGDLWQGQNSSGTVMAGFKSSGLAYFDATFTAGGTTGAQTINKPVNSVNFAAAATALTVTNSLVSTSSAVLCELQTNDATARIANVVPASGSYTINLTAAATAETRCTCVVINN